MQGKRNTGVCEKVGAREVRAQGVLENRYKVVSVEPDKRQPKKK